MTNLEEEKQEAVIRSVTQHIADKENVDSADLPPLYEAIDPTIFEYLPEPATLEFQYYGYTVVVNGDRTVAVQEPVDDNFCPTA